MLLGLQDVVFELGARVLLDGVRWQIQPGERIGLIGENGAGKSTLLKLLSGQCAPTSGYIEKGSQVKIGFLHQDLLAFETQDSILDIVLQGRPELYQMQRRLDFLTHKMTDSAEEQVFLEEYMRLLSSFEERGGYEITHQAARILEGLGFEKALHSRAYEQFSGGWRMRVLLAQMIFQNPDVLLLDEPTNHLDLPSIEWLEKYLQQYKGSVVIVSHDRFFLDKAVQKIVALAYRKLHFYSGNYSFYEKELALREALQQKAFDNQQSYIRQQERFIERFKAKASKANQAQSALKRLEKLDRVEAVQSKGTAMHLRFQVARQPGKMIVSIRDFAKSYGEKLLFQDLNADIMRGDKIALIGANGAGKSTLLRMITQAVSFEGTLQYGHNVQYAFYAQHQLDALGADRTIFEEVLDHASAHTTTQEIRMALGCFLFSGTDIDKKIKVLSGGERARVALCKMMLEKANFLILDEPTNHLDLRSINIVIAALQQYEGTVLLVSHDRHFIAQTANKIWLMQRQRIEEFLGNYDAFQLACASKVSAVPAASERVSEKKKKEKIVPASVLKKEKELRSIEQKLVILKQRQAQAEKHLCDEVVLSDAERYEAIRQDYAALEAEIAQWEERYNRIFSELFD